MNVEIGSLFEIDLKGVYRNIGNKLPSLPVECKHGLIPHYFNTGRSAVEALLRNLKRDGYRQVLLPSFLCDSVRDAVRRAGLDLSYYRVNIDLSIDVKSIEIEEKSILYVVQYFGKRINAEMKDAIKRIKQVGGTVIEDISLSLLSDGDDVGFGDYIIGSLRKWFPIVDGGILLAKEKITFELADASNDYSLYYFVAQLLKDLYLKESERDQRQKSLFLSYSNEGMKALFNDYTLRKMSMISTDLMKGVNIEFVRNKRIRNYDLLCAFLSKVPQVKVLVDRQGTMTPLGMLILVDNRDELLRRLISMGIYCNVHWRSNDLTRLFPESDFLANRCITIPCDQRYGEKEMRYIYSAVKGFYGG